MAFIRQRSAYNLELSFGLFRIVDDLVRVVAKGARALAFFARFETCRGKSHTRRRMVWTNSRRRCRGGGETLRPLRSGADAAGGAASQPQARGPARRRGCRAIGF